MNKKILIVISIIVLLVAGFYALNSYIYNEKQGSYNPNLYENKELGIRFDYPNTYVMQEMDTSTNTPELVKTIILMQNDAFEAINSENPPSEGPENISVLVFKNTNKVWPAVWAMQNIAYSNINLKIGEEVETTVDGAKAITYKADGLYASTNYVVTQGDYVYMISGNYIGQDSVIYKDFATLVESIKFIPAE